ncbi:MAG TPA: hypothetical protein EYN14_07310 [Alphaproteobacteria bacterium]|nr:hypothetical protein [Alphaproteobacteria bacterium]
MDGRKEDQAAGTPSEYDLTWDGGERWILTYTQENLFIVACTTKRAALNDGALRRPVNQPESKAAGSKDGVGCEM